MFSSFSLPVKWFQRSFGSGKRIIDLPSVQIHDSETATDKAARTLKHLLKANHANHAIIYNNLRFHNHMPHVLSSAYILGGNTQQLTKIYEVEEKDLEGWEPAPGEISKDDWTDYLGRRNYQRAWVDFFEDQLVAFGYDWKALLERFLYDKDTPLFSSLISGLGHPLIHLGYAYEINSRDVGIESLGLTACFYDDLHKYLDDPKYTRPSPIGSKSTLELLQTITTDKRLDGVDLHGTAEQNIEPLLKQREDVILDYWNAWEVAGEKPMDAFAESQQAATAVVIATRPEGHKYDFFLLHTLTSSHAVRILLPIVPAERQLDLVRSWWLFMILGYISQGRPAIDLSRIKSFKLNGRTWKDATNLALTSSHAQDAHYVKGIRAMQNAAETWGDSEEYFLKAGIKLATEFDGWGGGGTNH